MYVCDACIYACMYVVMRVCMHACMYACMYVCVSARHVCMYACLYAYMHACMYVCMWCMYVCVYVSIYACTDVYGCRRCSINMRRSKFLLWEHLLLRNRRLVTLNVFSTKYSSRKRACACFGWYRCVFQLHALTRLLFWMQRWPSVERNIFFQAGMWLRFATHQRHALGNKSSSRRAFSDPIVTTSLGRTHSLQIGGRSRTRLYGSHGCMYGCM